MSGRKYGKQLCCGAYGFGCAARCDRISRLSQSKRRQTKPDQSPNLLFMGFLIFLVVTALLVLWGVSIYNRLVRRRTLVEEGWSGIETQLKRRANLIPNLVETVKGYATHERATFDEITKLRNMAASMGDGTPSAAEIAARAQTERQITAMIGKIMAVAEFPAAAAVVVLSAGKATSLRGARLIFKRKAPRTQSRQYQ